MNNQSFKDNLKRYYDTEAGIRDGKSQKPEWKQRVREDFCRLVGAEGKHTLLELGAGAGYDSLFFMSRGLCVTAVDLSSEMVKRCREKGVDARELDFYNLTDLGAEFDSVYSLNTLLHVPKADLPGVLRGIDSVLADGGLFYMGLYGGDDREDSRVVTEVSDAPRYFVFNSAEYLRGLLPRYFDILRFDTLTVGENGDTFHSVTMRKKRV